MKYLHNLYYWLKGFITTLRGKREFSIKGAMVQYDDQTNPNAWLIRINGERFTYNPNTDYLFDEDGVPFMKADNYLSQLKENN